MITFKFIVCALLSAFIVCIYCVCIIVCIYGVCIIVCALLCTLTKIINVLWQTIGKLTAKEKMRKRHCVRSRVSSEWKFILFIVCIGHLILLLSTTNFLIKLCYLFFFFSKIMIEKPSTDLFQNYCNVILYFEYFTLVNLNIKPWLHFFSSKLSSRCLKVVGTMESLVQLLDIFSESIASQLS